MASNIILTHNSKLFHGSTKKNDDRSYLKSKSSFLSDRSRIRSRRTYRQKNNEKRLSSTIYAVTKGSAEPSKSEETVPSWAKPGSDESPPWAREGGEKPTSEAGFEAPFFVYLLASAFSAIAAVIFFSSFVPFSAKNSFNLNSYIMNIFFFLDFRLVLFSSTQTKSRFLV